MRSVGGGSGGCRGGGGKDISEPWRGRVGRRGEGKKNGEGNEKRDEGIGNSNTSSGATEDGEVGFEVGDQSATRNGNVLDETTSHLI